LITACLARQPPPSSLVASVRSGAGATPGASDKTRCSFLRRLDIVPSLQSAACLLGRLRPGPPQGRPAPFPSCGRRPLSQPSGDPTPSKEDIALTKRLVEVGTLIGIPLLDHVIVTDDRTASLRDRGPM